MLSIKSFKHDRYIINNSKHNLSKCVIIKLISNLRSDFNDKAINNLKQMINNCVIFTYLNDYDDYVIEYLGINFLNIYIYDHAFYEYDYDYYYDKYYRCSKQLHYQQKLLDNNIKISEKFNIKIYSKYTQLWIINNCKKIDK